MVTGATAVPRLRDVIEALDELYDPHWAQAWDAVGLVSGDPEAEVRRVLFAVDPVMSVIEEALAWEADLLVTHHPLLLRPVHGVAATTPKGRAVSALVRGGVALHVVHTNADVADPGVSDALGGALGLRDLRPLRPEPESQDKLVTFVPHADVAKVVDALAAAGAGRIGDYVRCAWMTSGTGTFVPLPGAQPSVGSVGAAEEVPETRVEMVLAASDRTAVVAALRSAHPYEEPAFDLIPLAPAPGKRGLGRVGGLDRDESLREFASRVAAALPRSHTPVRVAGDLDAPVRTVAVCGGAGDDMFDDVRRAGADAYVTADLRHHPASESREHGSPALVDCAHWATEWPWLADAERLLIATLLERDTTVETRISRLVTDPWNSSTSSTRLATEQSIDTGASR